MVFDEPVGCCFCIGQENAEIQILDAGGQLFWTSSYHATNMNVHSNAAGVNKATVCQHVRSKEAIAIATAARALERTEGRVFEARFAAPDDRLHISVALPIRSDGVRCRASLWV